MRKTYQFKALFASLECATVYFVPKAKNVLENVPCLKRHRWKSRLCPFSANFLRRAAHPQGWVLRGDSHLKKAELNEALKCYRKVARTGSEGADIWEKEGIVLGMMGRYMEAIFAFGQASKVDSGNFQAQMHRGFAFMRLERWQKAQSCFERAIVIKPDDGYARYCRELCEEEMANRTILIAEPARKS